MNFSLPFNLPALASPNQFYNATIPSKKIKRQVHHFRYGFFGVVSAPSISARLCAPLSDYISSSFEAINVQEYLPHVRTRPRTRGTKAKSMQCMWNNHDTRLGKHAANGISKTKRKNKNQEGRKSEENHGLHMQFLWQSYSLHCRCSIIQAQHCAGKVKFFENSSLNHNTSRSCSKFKLRSLVKFEQQEEGKEKETKP